MSRPVSSRKPRASSQLRIAAILDAARSLLAEQGVGGLSVYSVAERAQMPPSSVYHFFASVPALLEGLTADIHAAFRACLQAPIDHDRLDPPLRHGLGQQVHYPVWHLVRLVDRVRDDVPARVDADLRTGHFGNLAANHIVSAVAPPSAP
mgnify:CR=1 FL=1